MFLLELDVRNAGFTEQGHSAGARDKEETQAAHSRTGTLPIRGKRSKETENGD